MSTKPDWKDAPEWAQWLAMDGDGAWWWFQNEPEYTHASYQWNALGSVACAYEPDPAKKTKEARP